LFIFPFVNEQEEINKLREEMLSLHKQMKEQQQHLELMYKRLMELNKGNISYTQNNPLFEKKPFSAENFIGLRLIHLVGIIVLVIGLSIGVKYAIDRDFISEAARIMLAYAAGATLLFLSVRLRKNYEGFSAILFSGAMASLYFTTYAAFVYYKMIPSAVAFILMVILTVYTVLKAIDYNKQEIALLGLTGAYGIPFLISQNAERADLFFLYITIINCGVVYLSMRKQWKLLSRITQTITWILFIGWASVRYVPEQKTTAVIFLFIFFILFSIAILGRKIIYREKLLQQDAHQYLINNVAFYIAAILIFAHAMENQQLAAVSGFTGLFVGAQVMALSSFMDEEKNLKNILISLALLLIMFFVAFQWKGITVTLLWLLMAVIVFASGVFYRSIALRMAGISVIGLTLLKLILFDSMSFGPVQKVIAYLIVGVLLLVVSFYYQKFKEKLFND
jgi:uncharacterized membrane protein